MAEIPTWEPLSWRQGWRERGFTLCSQELNFPFDKAEVPPATLEASH